MYIYIVVSPWTFAECEIFQTIVVEKIKTRISCSTHYFQKSCHLWGNVGKYCRDGLHAGYLRLHTHTLRICNTHCFSTTTMVSRRASVLRYTYISCFFFLGIMPCKLSLNFRRHTECVIFVRCLSAWSVIGKNGNAGFQQLTPKTYVAQWHYAFLFDYWYYLYNISYYFLHQFY
jgi:hypothetical protein